MPLLRWYTFATFFIPSIISTLAFGQISSRLGFVSPDSLQQTEKELTGAAGVTVEGITDTISTRYTLTSGNRFASKYIAMRMKNYGAEVEQQYFHEQRTGVSNLHNVTFTCLMHQKESGRSCLSSDWGEIFCSGDSGSTWQSLYHSGVPDTNRLDWIIPLDSNTIAAFGSTGYSAVSHDNGSTWSRGFCGFSGISFVTGNRSNTILAVGSSGAVWTTDRFAVTWKQVTIDPSVNFTQAMFWDSTHAVLVGNSPSIGGKLFSSSNAGVSWNSSVSPTLKSLSSMYTFNQNLWWIGTTKGSIYQVRSNASTWREIFLGDTTSQVSRIFFIDSLRGWALTSNRTLYKTIDAGNSWVLLYTFEASQNMLSFYFFNSTVGIAVGGDYPGLRTDDGGVTWIERALPLSSNVVATVRGTVYPQKYIIFTAHSDCTIHPWIAPVWFESHGADDDGSGVAALIEMCRIISHNPLPITVRFAALPDEENYNTGQEICASRLFQKSETALAGIDFDMIGFDSLYPGSIVLSYPLDYSAKGIADRIVQQIVEHKIPLGVNRYENTSSANLEGFRKRKIPTLGIFEGQVGGSMNPHYHSPSDTYNNINYQFLSNIVKAVLAYAESFAVEVSLVDKNETEVPLGFSLSQNYPNPFNPHTTIRYSLPSSTHVTLNVYDLLGRHAETLVDGFKEAGVYFAVFNGAEFASGVYIAQLTMYPSASSTPVMQTMKMLMTK